jgi:membrane associated rhomboid family serine protease
MLSRLPTTLLQRKHAFIHTMQSMHRVSALKALLTRRTLPGSYHHSRFFASSPRSLRSQFYTSKRPTPTTMDTLTTTMYSSRRHYVWQQPLRFQSTKRMVNIIIAMNVGVFGAWVYADYFKDSKMQKLLMNNATLSWYNANANRYWTLVTSAFSHQGFNHVLFNMLSLNTFSGVLCVAGGVGVGALHIWVMTLGSAVVGGATWLYQKKPQGRDPRWSPWGQHGRAASHVGLGASGVVMAFASAATMLAPMQRLFIVPFPVPIPMFILTGAYFAMDVFYLNANDSVGHAAHLGGAAFGVAYYLAALRGYGGVANFLSRGR